MHRRLNLTRAFAVGVVALAVGLAPCSSAGANAAPPPASPGGLDTAVGTGSGKFFSNVHIHAQSAPSGQSPSGQVSFVLLGGIAVSGRVTCLSVAGPDKGGGTPAWPTDAVLNAQTGVSGVVTIELVDHGGNGKDTMSALPTSRAPTDCSAFHNGGITGPLTHGRATVFDAHPPNIFAVTLKSCTNLHVGYNYFPAGVVVHWRVNQTGTGTLATGSFTTLRGGKFGGRTYHFLTQPLGVTLQPDSRSRHTHVRFSWTIGSTKTHYEVTRDPGCAAGIPKSMAALGDSLTAGWNVCGAFMTCPAGSWSTGTTVNSHYERILAINPAISGHAFNFAVPGTPMSGLGGQVNSAVGKRVQYVTILIGANDVCTATEAQMTPVATFRSQFQTAMNSLTTGLPNAKVLVGSIPDLYRIWFIGKDNPAAPAAWAGFGCGAMFAHPTSTAQADVDRRARVRQRIIDFDTALAAVCAQHTNCKTDKDSMFAHQWTPGEISTVDYLHPNATGQNTLAALTYTNGYNW